jgi:hypothetical protein|tara:strand:+ start:321 stop:611 length:291 start_codon:yes stop_codon:yes gene_type:complete
MSEISQHNLERLDDCLSAINLKLSFWFDQDHFETDDEIEEIIHYVESGELGEYTDACIDEFLTMMHEHFSNPPHGSPLGSLEQPMGIVLDTNVTYD